MSAPAFIPSASRSPNGSAAPPQPTDGVPAARENGPTPEANLNTASVEFFESTYAAYLDDPQSVSPAWQSYFRSLAEGVGPAPPVGNGAVTTYPSPLGQDVSAAVALQERVDQLIRNYRVRGHIAAKIDPLGRHHDMPAELDPAFYQLGETEMEQEVLATYLGGPKRRTLRQVIDWLQATYCRSVGVQFMHIDSLHVRQWLQDRMEGSGNDIPLDPAEQRRIYERLADAVVFENFVAKKYVTKKRFSLEGAETLIPLLDQLIQKVGHQGVDEVVLGMAHRGRLNVLTNILGKSPTDIFREFEDNSPATDLYAGDVKYHLGRSANVTTVDGHEVHVSLCFNPSHLEFINPIAVGRVRAKQDREHGGDRGRKVCVLIHGDAAFAGEGIVQETLNMSELPDYAIGGTVHICLNNQIGFTTTEKQGRSTHYATDVAKMLQSPIFHVNGEDPEAVAHVLNLALDFRERFGKDVFIDMLCYRRLGHNEADEPSFTQPLMYKVIKERPTTDRSYLDTLVSRGGMDEADGKEILARCTARLEEHLKEAKATPTKPRNLTGGGVWRSFKAGNPLEDPDTGVPHEILSELLHKQGETPEGFTKHPRIDRGVLAPRRRMADGEQNLNWGAAESAAFASLLVGAGNFDGITPTRIRMSGQDCERGTFSHRHAVLHDYETGEQFTPLAHLAEDQATFEIANSPLSEAGVLGFEYGYSLDSPDAIVLWEAQFGDFVNVAQCIIDQFITSAEDKWRRLSGLIMLLPHGFEGQGPEHSSARLERFLGAAAEDNIEVTYPTTPDQYFHMLRRHALRKRRKPLIVMTPKSLLRAPAATSPLSTFTSGRFMRVIPDTRQTDPTTIKRILLCTGKVYYELDEYRNKFEREDVAIVRVEELAPFPERALADALEPFADGTDTVWVQEEPANMGAWRYMLASTNGTVVDRFPLRPVTRPPSASPAAGSYASHVFEQERLITEAFAEKEWKEACPLPGA
ncbi:MAG: 2-oxoglutarate dehydrogenase E1 component [Planctomycetota bacterium]